MHLAASALRARRAHASAHRQVVAPLRGLHSHPKHGHDRGRVCSANKSALKKCDAENSHTCAHARREFFSVKHVLGKKQFAMTCAAAVRDQIQVCCVLTQGTTSARLLGLMVAHAAVDDARGGARWQECGWTLLQVSGVPPIPSWRGAIACSWFRCCRWVHRVTELDLFQPVGRSLAPSVV